MALSTIPTITAFFILHSLLTIIMSEHHRFASVFSPENLNLKEEKLSHLHFYFHDIISGENRTAVKIVDPPLSKTSSTTGFGMVDIMDDPLTELPDLSSKLVGKAQGIYAFASQSEIGLLIVMNFEFVEGKYKGSCLSVLGRNAVFSGVREMPIVGGSGLFRFARGFALAKTHSIGFNVTVVEYNVYVFHY